MMIAAAIHDIAHPATNNVLLHDLIKGAGCSASRVEFAWDLGLSLGCSHVVSVLPCDTLSGLAVKLWLLPVVEKLLALDGPV